MGNPVDAQSGDARDERARVDQTAVLADFGRALASMPFERRHLEATVVRELSRTIGDAAVLFLLSADGERLEVVAAHHPDPEAVVLIRKIFSEVPHASDSGFLGSVLASREPMFLPEVPDELLRSVYDQPQHHRYFDTFGVHSLIIVPLIAHGTDLGVIAVARGERDRQYTSGDLAFVTELAERAALAFHIANTLDAERRVAGILRAVVDTAVDAIVIIDTRGCIQSANPATSQLFGYAVDELVGAGIDILMPEPYHSQHDEYLDRYLTTGVRRIIGIGREVSGRRKDGSTFPLELAVSEVILEDELLFAGVMRDISERKRFQMQLAKLAETDPLTGLSNRTALLRELDRHTEPGATTSTAVLFIDLDGFKHINDDHGHDTGDAVLEGIAQRIAATARSGDVVARYGGDEFAVVVTASSATECAPLAESVAERILDAVSQPVAVHGRQFSFTASIGIAVYPDDARTGAELLHEADLAMYTAKADRSGRFVRAAPRTTS